MRFFATFFVATLIAAVVAAPVATAQDPLELAQCTPVPVIGVVLVGACAAATCDPVEQVAKLPDVTCRAGAAVKGDPMCPLRLGWTICVA